MSDLRRFVSPDAADSRYGDLNREAYDPIRRSLMLPVANVIGELLPGLYLPSFAVAGSQHTRAPWPVWKDSTTAKVKFVPVNKKRAVKWYHKARKFERQTRQKGKQDGALGRNGLAVLHALIFDFLNYATGQLDPAIATIARAACISVRSAKRGLANLKRCGVLNWLRRAGETRDEQGRFCLEQDTNAYGLIAPTQWLGFIDIGEAPPPHPSTWGATPPLPPVIDQAAEELRHDAHKTALSILESDPADELAMQLASFECALATGKEARKPQ
jgi:hypothetical protein